MPADWKVPTGDDIWQVVSRAVVRKVDEDAAGGSNAGNNFDGSLDTRAKKAVAHAVDEIRAAIENAGRSSLSLTAGSVPPEGYQHALAIAAYRLCLPVPGLLAIVMAEGGVYSPITTLYKDAQQWVKEVNNGHQVIEPTDPAGRDYLTAVDDTNLAVDAIRNGPLDEAAPDWVEPA